MNTAIIEKLQKLLRHAESAREIGSTSEAEAFAFLAQQLLTKYGLSMSDVEIEEEKAAHETPEQEYVYAEDFGEKRKQRVETWQTRLFKGIASANNCYTLVVPGSNTQAVVGFQADRVQCIALFAYFVKLAKDIVEREFKAYKETDEYKNVAAYAWDRAEVAGHSRSWKQSFLEGFAQAISNRLYEAKKAAEVTVEQTEGQTAALVHQRNKEAIVKDFRKSQNYGKYSGGGGARSSGGYNAGHRAGSSVALTGNTLGSAKGALN